MKIFQTLRNNWKKSIFFSLCSLYGISWSKVKYKEHLLRRQYCEKAMVYGNEPLKWGENVRRVTVFLNPASQKGKGRKMFEKNAAPLLHLAGMEVNVIQTEYEGQAKAYMSVIDTDAVVVAGGDGTLLEVITGLMRRSDKEAVKTLPVGVIPVGTNNSFSRVLFRDNESRVKWILDAAMAIIEWRVKPVDVMYIQGEGDGKDVYAVTSLNWGPYRDAETRKPKYWYFGGLKSLWTYIWTGLMAWPRTVQARLDYVLPCDGCSRCYLPPPVPTWRWWHLFISPAKSTKESDVDYSKVENEECGRLHSEDVHTTEMTVLSSNVTQGSGMCVSLAPADISRMQFIQEGWSRRGVPYPHRGSLADDRLQVSQFTLQPVFQEDNSWFTIDNEQYESMKISVKLLKNKVNMFCQPS